MTCIVEWDIRKTSWVQFNNNYFQEIKSNYTHIVILDYYEFIYTNNFKSVDNHLDWIYYLYHLYYTYTCTIVRSIHRIGLTLLKS